MHRFIIMADLHLGLWGPQPDGKTYGDPVPIIELGIARTLEAQPDHVILLGDLVNRGHSHEYEQIKQLLRPVADRLVPALGNHELQRATIRDFEQHMEVQAFRVARICGVPAIILNSGMENLPDTQWQGELDSGHLAFLDRELERIDPGPLFVFVHHPIPATVRDSEKPMLGLTNGQELLRRLERRGGPVVVFSAHTHAQSFARHESIAFIGCPALGFWPHSLVTVEVDGKELRFSTTRVIDDPRLSPDADALDAAYRAAREGNLSDQGAVVSLAAS